MANTINASARLRKTYNPVNVVSVRRVDEARQRGRKAILTPPTPQLHPGRRSCLAATRAQVKMCGHAGLAESMILAALIAGPPPQCRRPLPAVALVAIPSPIAGVRSSCSPHAATAAPRR
jgi:hypothetical protein